MIVTSFFRFVDLSQERIALRDQLRKIEGIKGLIHLTPEGINGMASGTEAELQAMKDILESCPKLQGLEYKNSECPERPFPRWKVELKDQTILYGDQFRPSGERHNHITPAEWHALITSDEPVTLLDTRNRYETRLGIFKDAIDPDIDSFTEFSDYLRDCDLPKDQTTLIYCTGGIRCEKAILDMEEQGFSKVYQLEGGILKYLEEFPEQEFEGECFVFDNRVSVDQKLQPSQRFWLCPHCGDPGELKIACEHCGEEARICADCASVLPTCSKDCTYHWRRLGSKRNQTV
jgi:UPF0176 protein